MAGEANPGMMLDLGGFQGRRDEARGGAAGAGQLPDARIHGPSAARRPIAPIAGLERSSPRGTRRAEGV